MTALDSRYTIMPLRFGHIGSQILVTGEAGDFHFLTIPEFDTLLSETLDPGSTLFHDLKSKNLLATEQDLAQAVDLTATRYRSRKAFLNDFTSLHMMVVTVRCNHRCEYCQVSCEDEDAHHFDMSPDTARKVVEFIYNSPSPEMKIEFQGGEPLLNWPTVRAAVIHAENVNESRKKHISFVLCTNLTLMDEDKLAFLKEHNVHISTSLDGPKNLHEKNRRMRIGGDGSHDHYIEKLALTRKTLGHDMVTALMTTSATSLDRMTDVVDEYVLRGFSGMFIRSLNPYGFAQEKAKELGYGMDEFLAAYKRTLEYIVKLNLSGTYFVEFYTTLLLSRILTPYTTGFVDLQSPSGAGISGAIYDYNGDVYPADEARMLSRMGDQRFLMGNVTDPYESVFGGRVIKEIVQKSCLEVMPVCADCVFQPYCGADPVRNYLEFGDVTGRRPGSPFCEKHKGIFEHLFSLLRENNRDTMDVFWSWITRRPLKEIRHAEG